MKERVTVFAPATVANVGPAFDIMGFALERPGDTVSAAFGAQSGVRIVKIEGDGGRLSLDPIANTAGVAAQYLINLLGDKGQAISRGIELSVTKQMPLGSGLGSSAASAVAAAVAVHHLLGEPFTKEELLLATIEGERVACGSGHADNVAPSLYGGMVLIRCSQTPPQVISLPTPKGLNVVVASPDVEIRTRDARAVLPRLLPLGIAVSQMENVASLVTALYTGNTALLASSMRDELLEPARAPLIPHFAEARIAVLAAGGINCTISGSGPSLFSFVPDNADTSKVVAAFSAVYQSHGIGVSCVASAISSTGAQIIEET